MMGSAALAGVHFPMAYLVLASIGAFIVYRVDRLLVDSQEDEINAPERVLFRQSHRRALTLVLLIAIPLALIAIWALEPAWVLAAALLGCTGIAYPMRILPGGKRPKDIPWLKTAMIAFCWVIGGVVLPLLMLGGLVSTPLLSIQGVVVIALYRILYILPNLITADWLDREGDLSSGMSSLGGRLTASGVRTVAMTALCLALVLIIPLIFWGMPWWLLTVDVMGLVGLTASVFSVTRTGSGRIVLMDMWAGYPVVTWLLLVIISST